MESSASFLLGVKAAESYSRAEYGGEPTVLAPVTLPDLALTGGLSVGSVYALGKLGLPVAPGIGGAVRAAFGPAVVPVAGAFELLGYGLAPLNDPAYQSGEQGYFDSVARHVGANVDELGRAAREARERYGALGLPVQMLHGISNPLSSTLYLLKNIKDTLVGKEGAALAVRAQAEIAASLEARHAL